MSKRLRFVTTLAVAATLEWCLAWTATAQYKAGGPEHRPAEAKQGEATTKEQTPTPAPLTERERQLLDQICALERRLLTLESKVAAVTPGATAVQALSSRASGTSAVAAPAVGAPVGPFSGGFVSPLDLGAFAAPPLADAQPLPTPGPEVTAEPEGGPGAGAENSPAARESEAAKPPVEKAADPFAFADFTWLNGNARTKESPIDTKVFTGEFRVDTSYIYDFNHPQDDTLVGSSESGRTGEFQVQQLGIGGDFHYDNVIGRLMTQFGMYSTMTPRNDASPARGQWDLADAYRYISEAYGGYHIDKWNGINIEAGIFMSYVGLFSYYNFDNWAYQPSYVSSNTPWFFNGLRVQIFPSDKLKIEPWLINGWQSYGKFNTNPGLGLQILWRPTGFLSILSNTYGVGTDTLGNEKRMRWHSDDSIQIKYYDSPMRFLDKAAFSLTLDAGCESGGGVSCISGSATRPAQYFLGWMLYNRFWFAKDVFGLTIGGGQIDNPGRYLVLMPPINGATAASGTPYFTENPGDPFKAWDASVTLDYMPSQFVTFRWEFDHRAASVPYFAGSGGVTPPGGNTGPAGSLVPGWSPDLVKAENRMNMALLVKL
ncbi:MAG: outer membrane beta-barrel protein [Thermoanaerobaculaceae bacterium]